MSTFLQKNTPDFPLFYKKKPDFHFFTKKHTPIFHFFKTPHFISCLRAWFIVISHQYCTKKKHNLNYTLKNSGMMQATRKMKRAFVA